MPSRSPSPFEPGHAFGEEVPEQPGGEAPPEEGAHGRKMAGKNGKSLITPP